MSGLNSGTREMAGIAYRAFASSTVRRISVGIKSNQACSNNDNQTFLSEMDKLWYCIYSSMLT